MTWRAILPAMPLDADVDAPVVDRTPQRIRVAARPGGAGTCDRALVRAYVADEIELDAVVDELAHGVHPAYLHGGLAGIGWTIAHLASGAEAATAAISRVLRSRSGQYDLIGGSVGVGVFALEAGDDELAHAVLEHLEAWSARRWFTRADELVESERELAPGGYTNLGIAHGIPGVIALLARFVHRGIEPARSRAILDDAVDMVARVPSPIPTWHPSGDITPRLAWCYGDVGVAVSLVGAGVYANHPGAYERGLELARGAATSTIEIDETGLCHGIAGVAHLFNRLAQATGDELFDAAARKWFARLRARTDPARDGSFLLGQAGITLALHAATTEVEPTWDRLLLADLPPR